ncbi:MAG: zinc-dependent alcohol dehydrogenase [bacterium]
MLAAVLEGIRKMVVKEVPTPKVGPGEVLVRVKACGICQTDYSAYAGKRLNWKPPLIVGHEMSGIIERVGDGVDGWDVGDEVVISPVIFCGKCYNCRIGQNHYCVEGKVLGGDGQDIVLDGGFAEYIAVPTSVLYRKPSNVSFEAAALTEPLAGSYKGMVEYSQVRVAEDVVIIGAGSMGLLLAQIAVASGARTMVLDIVEFRLKKAKELGVDCVINLKEAGDPRKSVYKVFERGPDLVFEAAGTLEAARLAFDLTRRGTRINMFGVIVPGEIPISPANLHFSETRMDASFSVNPRVMMRALDLMGKGKVDPGKIITHRFPLREIQRAFDTMESPERVKIVINP